MTSRSHSWTKPLISVAAAGLGASVAGPIGGAIGGWLGEALGESAKQLIRQYTEKFGEKAGEKFLEIGADALSKKLEGPAPVLEAVYRETLRVSLEELHDQSWSKEFDDWFENWQECLRSTAPLNLSPIMPDQLAPGKLDDLFRVTMERLDRQGAALKQKDTSLTQQTRPIPDFLQSELTKLLPERLDQNFRDLITKSEHEQAFKQAQLDFQKFSAKTLVRIDETTQRLDRRTGEMADDISAVRKMLEQSFSPTAQAGLIADLQAKDLEIARLTKILQLQEQLASCASDLAEAELSKLISAGDFDAALALKTKQVETGIQRHAEETDKLARDQFELGIIQELRFDWSGALVAFREAWRLKRDPEYGFRYAYYAQRQNQSLEAIAVYEVLLWHK